MTDAVAQAEADLAELEAYVANGPVVSRVTCGRVVSLLREMLDVLREEGEKQGNTCGVLVGRLGDGTPVYCINDDGHSGLHAPLPQGL